MGRSPCCDKNALKKGPWTPEEDYKLIQYIQIHGPGNWRTLPKNAELQRCGKSCRLRWTNYLRPDIKRGRFSFEEEESIIQLHSILGNKWSAIAARLPGRTDNEIKNYWNTHIRKRLLRMGIDPVTHSPRLDLLDLSSILNSNIQLNLSNLLGLQTLLNPDLLRLFPTLLASNQENPEMVLQKLKENQILLDPQMQNQSPIGFHPNPPCTSSSIPNTSLANHTQLTQGLDLTNCQSFQQYLMPSNANGNFGSLPNYRSTTSNDISLDFSKTSGFQSTNKSDGMSENFMLFDSVLPNHMSSPTPLNSSSTFVNSNSTEEERESYCGDMFKFDIPESLDLVDFM